MTEEETKNDEEKTEEAVETQTESIEASEGAEPSEDTSKSLVYDATKVAERIEKSIKIMDEKMKKFEAMQVETALGGRSFGGGTIESKPRETDIEFANNMLNREVNLLIPKIKE
ncbi:hypothetical protein CMI37_38685 [Candidatus Pacearchaeota archaeon]|nr:hypothetical protein [Candidatus Pacearchaeota archaeon]